MTPLRKRQASAARKLRESHRKRGLRIAKLEKALRQTIAVIDRVIIYPPRDAKVVERWRTVLKGAK